MHPVNSNCIYCNSTVEPCSKGEVLLLCRLQTCSYLLHRSSPQRNQVLPMKYQFVLAPHGRRKYYNVISRLKPFTQSLATTPSDKFLVSEEFHHTVQACGHVVHSSCISQNLQVGPYPHDRVCPVCKQIFTHFMPWIKVPTLLELFEEPTLVTSIRDACRIIPGEPWILHDIQATMLTELYMEVDLLLSGCGVKNWKKMSSRFPWQEVWSWCKLRAVDNILLSSKSILEARTAEKSPESPKLTMEWFVAQYFHKTGQYALPGLELDAPFVSCFRWDPAELLVAACSCYYGEKMAFIDIFRLVFNFAYVQSFINCIGNFTDVEFNNWFKYQSDDNNSEVEAHDLIVTHFFIISAHLHHAGGGSKWKNLRPALNVRDPPHHVDYEHDVYTVTRIEKDLKLQMLPMMRLATLIELIRRSYSNEYVACPPLCQDGLQMNLIHEFDEHVKFLLTPPRHGVLPKLLQKEDPDAEETSQKPEPAVIFPLNLIPDNETLTEFLHMLVSEEARFSDFISSKSVEKPRSEVDFLLDLCPPHLIDLPDHLWEVRFINGPSVLHERLCKIPETYLCLVCGRHPHPAVRPEDPAMKNCFSWLCNHVQKSCQYPMGLFLQLENGLVWVVSFDLMKTAKVACWGELYPWDKIREERAEERRKAEEEALKLTKWKNANYSNADKKGDCDESEDKEEEKEENKRDFLGPVLDKERYELLNHQWISQSFSLLLKNWTTC